MCAAVVPFLPLISAGVGAAATIYGAQQASKDAASAREVQERQMQQQLQLAREEASRPSSPQQASSYTTAAVQANRQRVAGMQGMGSTITGAGLFDNNNRQNGMNVTSGLGYGTKKQLGA